MPANNRLDLIQRLKSYMFVVQVTKCWRGLLGDCIIIYINDSETKPGERQGMQHAYAGGETP